VPSLLNEQYVRPQKRPCQPFDTVTEKVEPGGISQPPPEGAGKPAFPAAPAQMVCDVLLTNENVRVPPVSALASGDGWIANCQNATVKKISINVTAPVRRGFTLCFMFFSTVPGSIILLRVSQEADKIRGIEGQNLSLRASFFLKLLPYSHI
jgi:hypothetical protein